MTGRDILWVEVDSHYLSANILQSPLTKGFWILLQPALSIYVHLCGLQNKHATDMQVLDLETCSVPDPCLRKISCCGLWNRKKPRCKAAALSQPGAAEPELINVTGSKLPAIRTHLISCSFHCPVYLSPQLSWMMILLHILHMNYIIIIIRQSHKLLLFNKKHGRSDRGQGP